MDITLREEMPGDDRRIERVIEAAFRKAQHTNHAEQFIVKSLRECDALTLSLVAEVDGEIVGQVAISPVCISDGALNWYGLGPISVLPAYQGKGVGSRLMRAALEVIKAKGAAGCVVLGEPGYYGRFGFKAAAGLTLPGVPPEYFQALSFGGDLAQGEVGFHQAFSAQG